MTKPDRAPDRENVVDWGVATGRYSPARAQFWARQADEERRKTGSTTETEATIRSLAPVYDVSEFTWTRDPETGHAVLNTAPPVSGLSDTPRLEDLERQLFGASTEERYRAEDLAAEAELAEAIERERHVASAPQATEAERQVLAAEAALARERRETPGQLTDAEERAIFGPDNG